MEVSDGSGVAIAELQSRIIACRRCPRLVAWRESVAGEPPRRFAGEPYWARPVPGFGDPSATLVLVGLAPAAHGANRTGRMFTGDRSGDWLYGALYRAGLASQPTSEGADDGLRLTGCYVTAVVRCAPPANRPTPVERDECVAYLAEELGSLRRARTILALGSFAWDGALRAARAHGVDLRPKPRFAHGAEADLGSRWQMVGSYHPSQQNTFTGKLTEAMFDAVVGRALDLAQAGVDLRAGGPRAYKSP